MAPVNNLLAQLAQHPELDRQAVLRVAQQEGLGGGIGDGGHAFGPFQLNNAGGVITGRPGSPSQLQAWAWSPDGIRFALQRISSVAGGLHGSQAVNAIVRQFERPADPNGEVSRALGGAQPQPQPQGGPVGQGPVGMAPQQQRQAGSQVNPHLLQILLATREAVGLPAPGQALTRQFAQAFQPQPLPARRGATAPVRPIPAATTGPPTRNLAELLLEGTGGPTHSTGPHVHVASTNPQTMLQLLQLGRSLGLTELENPYVGSVSPSVHAKNSFHDRTFPGLYNGRRLGEATDFSGPAMRRFYQLVQKRFGSPTS